MEKNVDGAVSSYLIDAYNHTGYAQVFEETTGANTTAYIIGDDVLAQATGTTATSIDYLLYDGHGSTRQLTDNNGVQKTDQSYSYDAYGVMLGGNPEPTNLAGTNLLYAGEHFDTDAQNYYLRARWYDSLSGRFNRMDPFPGNNQDPQSLHKYLYVHCNPINGLDPSGKITVFRVVAVVCIAAILGTILWLNISQQRATQVITGGLGALEFTEDDFVQLVNGMQQGTLKIPYVVDNYNSNNWVEWGENCEDAGVFTIGIYGVGAVGEDLTLGQRNIVEYFEEPAWFDGHPGMRELYPARAGEPGYELKEGYAEMVRMNAAIAECRDFAGDEQFLYRINDWDAPDPWEEIYGAP